MSGASAWKWTEKKLPEDESNWYFKEPFTCVGINDRAVKRPQAYSSSKEVTPLVLPLSRRAKELKFVWIVHEAIRKMSALAKPAPSTKRSNTCVDTAKQLLACAFDTSAIHHLLIDQGSCDRHKVRLVPFQGTNMHVGSTVNRYTVVTRSTRESAERKDPPVVCCCILHVGACARDIASTTLISVEVTSNGSSFFWQLCHTYTL